MALDTTTIEPGETKAAPLAYKLKQAEALGPQSISATFDGTGAGGPFLPCVTFKAQDGKVIARCPASTLQVGDTAEVTFAPFLRSIGSGGGIQFDVNNTGDWLDVTTTGVDGGGDALNLVTTGTGGQVIEQDGSGKQEFLVTGAGGQSLINSGNGVQRIQSSGTAGQIIINSNGPGQTIENDAGAQLIKNTGTGKLTIESTGDDLVLTAPPANIVIGVSNVETIGFYGATPVGPQVSGGTLPGVIAGLVALGLFSS